MKQAAKRVTGLLAAWALLVALVPGTIWAAGSESETGSGTSINEIQSDSLPTGTEGGADSGNLPEGSPSGGSSGFTTSESNPAEPEEPEAQTPGASPEDGDTLPGDTPEPGSDAPESEPEELELEDDTDDAPAPLVRPSNRLIMPTALTDDLAVGTWTEQHRWVEFGGIVWRVLEVTVSDGSDGNTDGNKTAFLLAEDLLPETMQFDDTGSSNNDWNGSSIRAWLNNTNDGFLSRFSDEQRGAIVTSHYDYGGQYANDTDTDSSQVFLLSVDEANRLDYFANDGDRVAYLNNNSLPWWLRSPGDADNAAYVDIHGGVQPDGDSVSFVSGIRPALKINLASDIFSSSDLRVKANISVQDESSNAISGAKVVLTGGAAAPGAICTNSNGIASPMVGLGQYTLTVTKAGYNTHSGPITLGYGSSNCSVTLESNKSLPEIVDFGAFSGSPLTWRVLDVDNENGAALLLAANTVGTTDTQDNIVNWLTDTGNSGFLDSTNFSVDEQAAMTIYSETASKVFLLSEDEAELYLPDIDMRAIGSAWWLRNPVGGFVGPDGRYGESTFHNRLARPAVWVDLNKLVQVVDDGGNTTLAPAHSVTVNVRNGGAAVDNADVTITPADGNALRHWDGTAMALAGTTTSGTGAAFTLPAGSYHVAGEAAVDGVLKRGNGTLVVDGNGSSTNIDLYTVPHITNTAPSGTSAPANGEITITFSEAMDTSTPGTVSLNSTTLTAAGAWNNTDTEYTIAYSGLAYGTPYTIEVSGFESVNGVAMQPNTNAGSFTPTKTDVSGNITFGDGSAIYTGSALTHETATVSGFTPSGNPVWTYTYTTTPPASLDSGKPLTAGAYTVTAEYEDDDHMGSATATFTINPASIADAVVTVDGSYTYTGAAQTPAAADVTVALGGTTLTNGTDYTYTASNHTNAGEATVTVTGTGNYTGTATGSFAIEKASLSIASATIAPKTYNGSASVAVTAAALTGMVNNESLTFGTDFTATAAFDDANAGTGKTATVTATLNTTGPAANYTLASSTHTLTGQEISPKPVVVWVEDMEIQQGAALPTPQVTYTGFVGADDETNALATQAVAEALPVSDSSKAGTWTVGFAQNAALNNTTGANYTLEHKPGTLTITEKPTEPTKPIEPDKQPDPISFESLPENNTVRVGEKFTLTPTEDGQTGSTGWSWDSEFFSATFNSPATFTALKAGSSTITYTAPDGRVASVTITIQAASDSGTSGSAITATGDSSRMGLYASLAILAASGAGVALVYRKRRKTNI